MVNKADLDSTVGERIKSRRILRGWSIRYAASRAGISHASWSRLERGLQTASNRFVLADLAAALACSPADLTGCPEPGADRQAIVAKTNGEEIRKALINSDILAPIDIAARPILELEHELALIRDLRYKCDYSRMTRLLPSLLLELHASTGGADRTRALRLFCEATFLCSSVLRVLGHPTDAWVGAERCRDSAKAMNDHVLIGYAALACASSAGVCGAHQRKLTILDHAIQELDQHTDLPGGREMLGMLFLSRAAVSQKAESLEDLALWTREATAMAKSTGETSTLGLFFGPTNVNFWRIGLANDCLEARLAIEISQVTSPTVISAPMRRVDFHIELARSYSLLRGAEYETIRHLLAAERIAPQNMHASTRAADAVRTVLERAKQEVHQSALRGMYSRMGLSMG